MKVSSILATICTYLNAREEFAGVPFIQTPTNTPAPVGNYIAVKCDGVEQQGSEMKPYRPGDDPSRFISTATISLTEVEGDGDNLRKAMQLMQRSDFLATAADAGFTIWNTAATFPVDTFDGKFFVRQWRGTIETNFVEEYETETSAIEKVEGTLENQPISYGERITDETGAYIVAETEGVNRQSLEVDRG